MAYRTAVLAGRAGTETETRGQVLDQVRLPFKQWRVETSTLDQYAWARPPAHRPFMARSGWVT